MRRTVRCFTLSGEVQGRIDQWVDYLKARGVTAVPTTTADLTPTLVAAAPVAVDGLTPANYTELYEQFLPSVPLEKRTTTMLSEFVTHLSGYGTSWAGGTQKMLVDNAALNARIKEMRSQNKQTTWRAKQDTCHEPKTLSASRFIDALLVLGLDTIEERLSVGLDTLEKRLGPPTKTKKSPPPTKTGKKALTKPIAKPPKKAA